MNLIQITTTRVDDDESMSTFGGCSAAVAALGCDFNFMGELISETCLKVVMLRKYRTSIECTDDDESMSALVVVLPL